MYMLIRKESEKDMVAKYAQLEKDILKLIASGKPLSESKLVRSEAVAAVVRDAWNLDLQRQVMASSEMSLDVERLPLGRLQRDQIIKCYKILNSIAKILLSQEKGKQEAVVNSLSMDFYQIIPHNHGIRKPVMIDHLLRIKEKIRMLEILGHIQISQSLLTHQEVNLATNARDRSSSL
jgi:hypothetical protein